MTTATVGTWHHSRFIREHPELRSVCEWSGWPDGTFHSRRVLLAQIVHLLRRDGDIHTSNSSGVLWERCRDYGVEGLPSSGGGRRELLADVERMGWATTVINGKRTMSIELNRDAPLPPDPFDLRPPVKASQPRVTTAAGLMAILDRDNARNEDGLGNGGPDPSYVPPDVPAPETGPEVPTAPEPNAEPDPTAPSHEPTPAPETGDYEVVIPDALPVISDVFLGDTSIPLVDQCALLMRLAGNLMVAVSAMEVGLSEQPVDVDMASRLGAAVEETQTLRRRLAKASEAVAKAESARNQEKAALLALQRQNVILGENLQKALRGDQRPDDSGRKALDQMMREKPRIAS